MTTTNETLPTTFDFGAGLVAAHRHRNPNGSLGGWVADTAQVFGKAQVSGEARVFGGARVSGGAQVFGKAQVFGEARVSGGAQVSGGARVFGKAQVFGEALVSGSAWVFGKARVFGGAQVSGEARVSGTAWVFGEARVVQVGPVGSRGAMLTVYATKAGPRCTTGCFEDKTLAELLAACKDTHGPKSPHTRNYKLLATVAFAFIKANAKKGATR